MAIEVLDAWTQRGWSSTDYMIDDTKIKRVIGQTFRSYPLALRAAEKLADKRGFAAIRYLDTITGEIWTRGAEPNLPGRTPLARYERTMDREIAEALASKKSRSHTPRLGPKEWFHGTSTTVWEALKSGKTIPIQRVFREANVSLGGTYLTRKYPLAKVYADLAAREIGGDPIVLVVKEQFPLLPDEDLAAKLTDYRVPETKDRRLRGFVDALFADPNYYDGVSMSDLYRDRYDELNDEFGITWKDSLKYTDNVRQKQPLRASQVVDEVPFA